MPDAAEGANGLKRILAGCLTGLLLLFSWVFASSESADIADAETANRTAAEIRTGITFSGNGKSENFQDMQDDDFGTYYPLKDKKGWLEVHCEEEIYGIYLMQFEKITVPLSYDLQIPDGNGEWKTVAQGGQYLTHWHPLAEGVHEFRISATSRERIRIAELRLYGKGEKPREVQNWQSIEKCDLMLLTGHPDDEILWFAGLLPTYAGERRLRACVMCGKTRIPCIVISCSDDEALIFSIEENIQRTDLNIIEEAQSISSYMTAKNISQNEAAGNLSREPSDIADMIDLLRLDESERELVLRYHLSIRHAKALLRIQDKLERRIVLSEIIENSMNVSQTERYIDEILYSTHLERLRSQRRKGVLRDIRMFENTIKKAVSALNSSGIEAAAEYYEDDACIEYTVRIPKDIPFDGSLAA